MRVEGWSGLPGGHGSQVDSSVSTVPMYPATHAHSVTRLLPVPEVLPKWGEIFSCKGHICEKFSAFEGHVFQGICFQRQKSVKRFKSPPLRAEAVPRFRNGLVFKAHSLLYHSTLGLRIIKNKVPREERAGCADVGHRASRARVLASRCRANMAHSRQSRPDAGHDSQVKVFKRFKSFAWKWYLKKKGQAEIPMHKVTDLKSIQNALTGKSLLIR